MQLLREHDQRHHIAGNEAPRSEPSDKANDGTVDADHKEEQAEDQESDDDTDSTAPAPSTSRSASHFDIPVLLSQAQLPALAENGEGPGAPAAAASSTITTLPSKGIKRPDSRDTAASSFGAVLLSPTMTHRSDDVDRACTSSSVVDHDGSAVTSGAKGCEPPTKDAEDDVPNKRLSGVSFMTVTFGQL